MKATTVADNINRVFRDQWTLLFLLGGFTCASIVLGGALVYLFGDFLIPLLLVCGFVFGIQYQALFVVRRSAKTVIEQFPFLFLSRTQKYLIDHQTPLRASAGLIVLACRLENRIMLQEVLAPLCGDYGYDFVLKWLFDDVNLSHQEFEWMVKTLGFQKAENANHVCH